MEKSPFDAKNEFQRILASCGSLMAIEVQKFNLSKYGLDPEDILQDVKVRLWQVVSSERRILSPSAYIRRTVSSAVIDHLRKRRRDEGLVRREEQVRVSEQRDLYSREAARKKAIEEQVGRAVEKLISSRRQVVKLYLLSLNIPEIASYLNWTPNKTRNLLYRGLADLKECLREMEAENDHR